MGHDWRPVQTCSLEDLPLPPALASSGGHCRAFVNTRLLVNKHVKISMDEWILETTHPQKHVKFLEQYIP